MENVIITLIIIYGVVTVIKSILNYAQESKKIDLEMMKYEKEESNK